MLLDVPTAKQRALSGFVEETVVPKATLCEPSVVSSMGAVVAPAGMPVVEQAPPIVVLVRVQGVVVVAFCTVCFLVTVTVVVAVVVLMVAPSFLGGL